MKVKFANKVFEVLYTKEVAGLTMYAVEDEPNHIDWLINVEVIDANKKDLKKIEQKPSWSEEDEKMVNSILSSLEYFDYWDEKLKKKVRQKLVIKEVDWLKSIKERVQPQPKQEWKQENPGDLTDFENAMMHIGESFFGKNAGLNPNDTNTIKEQANILSKLVPKHEWSEKDERMLNSIIEVLEVTPSARFIPIKRETMIPWLKSIKEKYTWKPSDEQMKQLGQVAEQNKDNTLGKELMTLYNDLKKLKKE